MPLTDRERWIHTYTVVTLLGEAYGEPEFVIDETIKAMKKERCRKLTDQQIDEISNELEVDAIACCDAIDDLMHRMECNAYGHGGRSS